MCDPKILQEAIEKYLEEEEQLFGGLDTGPQTWYKDSVEDNASAINQSPVEPTMNTNQDQTNQTETNAQEANMKDKMNHAAEATKGFFKKHAGFVGFVLGVVTCAGAQAGYEAYKNRSESATGGSEQAS